MSVTAMIAVLIVIVVGFGRHQASYWSCQLLIILSSVTLIAGLRRYGARGEHADDLGPGDDTGKRAPAPASTL